MSAGWVGEGLRFNLMGLAALDVGFRTWDWNLSFGPASVVFRSFRERWPFWSKSHCLTV